MAKKERARRPASAAADEASADSGATKTYRVKAGQTVQGGDPDNEGQLITYGEGDEVELTEKEAAAIPWAVESGDRRERGGQTSRLKQRISDLEAEIKRLNGDDKARRSAANDPKRAEAIESLKARGDNFIGRGEPEAGKVPPDVLDAHDAAVLRGEMGETETDDEAAGMKGIARERAGSGETKPVPGVEGAAASQPANVQPGQSQRPGSSEPS
jgi:hypothetical protein